MEGIVAEILFQRDFCSHTYAAFQQFSFQVREIVDFFIVNSTTLSLQRDSDVYTHSYLALIISINLSSLYCSL